MQTRKKSTELKYRDHLKRHYRKLQRINGVEKAKLGFEMEKFISELRMLVKESEASYHRAA